MSSRRTFIKQTIQSSSFIGLGGMSNLSFDKSNKKHITILHTNDVHSHLEAFKSSHPNYANLGGISKRLTLINSIRKANPNTLLFDAGDIFQDTPYYNFYGGAIEFAAMNKLGYDATTLGNHDFCNSLEDLNKQFSKAHFDILIANYNFDNTLLSGKTKPYKIYIKEGVRIGVFGLGIRLENNVNSNLYQETKYLDPIMLAQDISSTLKHQEACDLVICLSHLGYQYRSNQVSDVVLAQRTKDIDLIIGGHTHTFLDKPTVLHNAIDQPVLVNQVGWAGLYLGRVDFYIDATSKINFGEALAIQ